MNRAIVQIGLAGAGYLLTRHRRRQRSLSEMSIAPDDPVGTAMEALSVAKSATESIKGCKRKSLTAIQVAERNLGRVQALLSAIPTGDERSQIQRKFNRVSIELGERAGDLSRCITDK